MKINYDTVKAEQSVDELFRMKLELTDETSELHSEYHGGNTDRNKSEILSDINFNNALLEYINDRIKVRKVEIYIADKEHKHRLKRFKDTCRLMLDKELFSRLEKESFK